MKMQLLYFFVLAGYILTFLHIDGFLHLDGIIRI